jgi:hypothetical protein
LEHLMRCERATFNLCSGEANGKVCAEISLLSLH